MPTYEYRCPNGHMFEKFFPTMNTKRRVRCPKCGKPAERLISGGAGLHFKGSGFYATDYKRAEKKPEGEATSDGESKTESPKKSDGESKTESPKKKDSKDK